MKRIKYFNHIYKVDDFSDVLLSDKGFNNMAIFDLQNNSFIEDCEVCCNPLEFNVKFEEYALIHFSVKQF